MKQFLQIFLRQFFCILKHNIAIKIYQPHNDLKIFKVAFDWLFEYNESTTEDS